MDRPIDVERTRRRARARRGTPCSTGPGSVRAVAVLRIAIGPITLLHLRPFLRDAVDGVSYDDHFWEPFIPWLPHLPDRLWFAMLWVGAVAAVLMTIGLWTRFATATAFVVVAGNLLLSQTHFRHNRAFLAIVLGGVALLPAGRVLSVDAWWRRRRGSAGPDRRRVALWPLWLLRAQVCLVYLASGISKLVDPDWFGGLVLWDRVVRYQYVLEPTPLPGWAIDLLTERWLYYVVGPAAVFTELFIGVGLWFGRTRLAAVWVAIVFHVLIEVSASVEVFSFVAIAALAIWVTPSTRDRTVRVGGDAATSRAVIALVRAGDWFGRFRVVRAAPSEPVITVVDRDGTVSHGGSGGRAAAQPVPAHVSGGRAGSVLASRHRRHAERGGGRVRTRTRVAVGGRAVGRIVRARSGSASWRRRTARTRRRAELEASAVAAGAWIERGQGDDGRYVYEYDRDADRVVSRLQHRAPRRRDDVAVPTRPGGPSRGRSTRPTRRWPMMLDNLVPAGDGMAFVDNDTSAAPRGERADGRGPRPAPRRDGRRPLRRRAAGAGSVPRRPDHHRRADAQRVRPAGRGAESRVRRRDTRRARRRGRWPSCTTSSPTRAGMRPSRRVLDYLATSRDEVEGLDFPPWPDQWAAYTLAELAPWGLDEHHVRYAEALSERFGMLVRSESQKDGWPLPFIDPRARGAGLGVWVEGLGALARAADSDDRLADVRPALGRARDVRRGTAGRAPAGSRGRPPAWDSPDSRRRRLVPLRRDPHGRSTTRPVRPLGRGWRAWARWAREVAARAARGGEPVRRRGRAVAAGAPTRRWPWRPRSRAPSPSCGAAVSGPVLDALDVTPGTFRVAAAVVLGLAGARWLIVGAPSVAAEGPATGCGTAGGAAADPGARDAAAGDREHVGRSRRRRCGRRRGSRRQPRPGVGRRRSSPSAIRSAGPPACVSSRHSPWSSPWRSPSTASRRSEPRNPCRVVSPSRSRSATTAREA